MRIIGFIFLCLLAIASAADSGEIVARWVFDGQPDHTIVAFKDSNIWVENFLTKSNYTFKEIDNKGDVILFSKLQNAFAKLTNTRIIYARTIEDARAENVLFAWKGKWDKKPKRSDVVPSRRRATTTPRPPRRRSTTPKVGEVVARWVFADQPTHTIVAFKNSNIWVENYLIQVNHTFQEFTDDGGVILFTPSIRAYAKLTDDKIMLSRDIDELRKNIFPHAVAGSWDIKPTKSDVTPTTTPSPSSSASSTPTAASSTPTATSSTPTASATTTGVSSTIKAKTTTPARRNRVGARWNSDKNDDHFFILMDGQWNEFKVLSPTKYTVVESEDDNDDEVILRSSKLDKYVKITDTAIYYSKNLNKLRNGKFDVKEKGHWVIKPGSNELINFVTTARSPRSRTTTPKKRSRDTTRAPRRTTKAHPRRTTRKSRKDDITGKWVFKTGSNQHYLVNKDNSIHWQEVDRRKSPVKYVFVEYTWDDAIILYSSTTRTYVKLTDSKISYDSDINQLRRGRSNRSASGSWEVEPDSDIVDSEDDN